MDALYVPPELYTTHFAVKITRILEFQNDIHTHFRPDPNSTVRYCLDTVQLRYCLDCTHTVLFGHCTISQNMNKNDEQSYNPQNQLQLIYGLRQAVGVVLLLVATDLWPATSSSKRSRTVSQGAITER